MENFFQILLHYINEIIPALVIGFFISGIVHELLPADLTQRYLGKKGFAPIFYSTLIGALLPVCCWGSLPIAVSFYKKGARLGPMLAFLVATPATSVSALLVTYSVLGLTFTVYIFIAVIIMGLVMGVVGNMIRYTPKEIPPEESCPHCKIDANHAEHHDKKSPTTRLISILRYAFIVLPKEIGAELFVGLVLAAVVATFIPIGTFVKGYLGGGLGYLFSVVFGIITYLCSTASVPLIDSLMQQGMNHGAAMTLLIIGPVTSYGTILVIRKEFGLKALLIFLSTLIATSLLLGIGFQLLTGI